MKKSDIEFSRKDLGKKVYSIAFDDIDDLYFAMQQDKFNFKKLDDLVYLESCGKNKYNFGWNSLNVIVERTKDTYKIKDIEVYDLKTQEFLCYMKIKK